jgi:putative ABC transport system ATP-binding protein
MPGPSHVCVALHKTAQMAQQNLSAIRTRDLSKAYAGTRVLNGIDLDVHEGEWVALMGPSGCGKSTLLNLIGGLDEVDRGTIAIGGTDIASMTPSQRSVFRRQHVGVVFQSFNLVPHLSVSANIELPLRLSGLTQRAAHIRSVELLDRLGLTTYARSSPTTLSGGQQQRVAIARAVANQPTILLADEPTGSLDSGAATLVIELLAEEHERGQTIVMVTHDETVSSAADRVIRMHDGALLANTHFVSIPAR